LTAFVQTSQPFNIDGTHASVLVPGVQVTIVQNAKRPKIIEQSAHSSIAPTLGLGECADRDVDVRAIAICVTGEQKE
jgi:hypothetical protein